MTVVAVSGLEGPYAVVAAHGAWLLAWSLVAFVAYAIDKRAAQAGSDLIGPRRALGSRGTSKRRRIRERTLHMLALIGGFPGAWLGRRTLRHKTRKRGFGGVLVLAALFHAALLAAVLLSAAP